jgi:uncharacterized damage-inducible protein DinB
MKEIFVMYAKYNRETNKTIYGILDKLSNEEREKDRGSYYGSLSGLYRHILGGSLFFLGTLFKPVLSGNAAASRAIAPLDGLSVPEGPLGEAGWKALAASFETVDKALVEAASSLHEADLGLPVTIDWYGGNPASLPLSFMLHQMVMHGTHHRGQLSQILDELKIDNDYSGINTAFLPG